ncbi:hypothetical protein [Thiohalorhabdus denitrificans]|uniref:hypothetical protein n=1 Tax=Thiohalorhabdus denitrificans TaxID=381306 RepID=UPI000AF845CD|nr:hypothetical protein [Thiohalorhabdus denitrificans]
MLNYISANKAMDSFFRADNKNIFLVRYVILTQIIIVALGYYSMLGSAPEYPILFMEIPVVILMIAVGTTFSFKSYNIEKELGFSGFLFLVSPPFMLQSFLIYFLGLNALAYILSRFYRVGVTEWEVINSIFIILVYGQFYARLYFFSRAVSSKFPNQPNAK